MITVEVWRARIGLFASCKQPRTATGIGTCVSNGGGLLLSVAFGLAILLVMAGVEVNPGPKELEPNKTTKNVDKITTHFPSTPSRMTRLRASSISDLSPTNSQLQSKCEMDESVLENIIERAIAKALDKAVNSFNITLCNKLGEIEKKITTYANRLTLTEDKLRNMEGELAEQRNLLNDLNNQSQSKSQSNSSDNWRKYNLVLHGVEDHQIPNTLAAKDVFVRVCKEKLNINNVTVNHCVYFQNKKNTSECTIIVTILDMEHRWKILKNCFKLKGSKFSITQDLSPEIRIRQRELQKYKREATDQGKKATFRGNKLIIDSEIFVLENDQLKSVGLLQPQKERVFTRSVSGQHGTED